MSSLVSNLKQISNSDELFSANNTEKYSESCLTFELKRNTNIQD